MTDLYRIIRPILFSLDAERSHDLTLALLTAISKHPLLYKSLRHQYADKLPQVPTKAMGITFPNPVGLAAGLDKNAAACNALSALGFGWVELGTVTPKPQPGNPKPRLFRLKDEQAIINRMGFNGAGLEKFLQNLQYAQKHIIKGINIGKNAATPMANAADDYALALRQVYLHADYVTINISSPNTKNLRELQQQEELGQLLHRLQTEREALTEQHSRYVPMVLKIAPDINLEQCEGICALLRQYKMDGVAATNTTISRAPLKNHPLASETGGLSGRPLAPLSTEVVLRLSQNLQGEIPIIAIGGIHNSCTAQEKLDAGAQLVQIYSGFIYQGPSLIREIVTSIARQSN